MDVESLGWTGFEKPARAEVIQAVQAELGVVFPADYVECIARFHGGKPRRRRFSYNHPDMGLVGGSLALLLSFRGSDMESLIRIHRRLTVRSTNPLPPQLIPFGTDGGGDFVCFDYRDVDDANPHVAYWAHEELPPHNVIWLADTFTAFLESLKEPDSGVTSTGA